MRSILEGILLDPMYDLPGNDDVSEIIIDEAVVNIHKKPIMIYEPKKAKNTPENNLKSNKEAS